MITLLGFSWDGSSSYAKGPALAPATIRSLLYSDVSSSYSFNGTHIPDVITHHDFAELPADAKDVRNEIEKRVSAAISKGNKPLSLGGDHSVSLPILKAIHAVHGPVNVLHIDAHPDMYDELEGDEYSHACPFRRAIEAGYIDTLVQLGLRSVSPDNRAFGEKHGVIMLSPDQIGDAPLEKLTSPLYISIDLDGFDPAFAPGVSHPEPGGLTSREVFGLLTKLPNKPVGADVVELNPINDHNLLTAGLAVRLVKELSALMS